MSRSSDSQSGLSAWEMRFCISLGIAICALASGCVRLNEANLRRIAKVAEFSTPSMVSVEKKPRNRLLDKIEFAVAGSAELSERTERVLRRYDLRKQYSRDAGQTLRFLEQEIQRDPDLELVFAFSELAQIRGDISDFRSQTEQAKKWYMTSVTSAYRYLFDPWFYDQRNSYDPAFRGACDLYNKSLEKLLRLLEHEGQLVPGHSENFSLGREQFEITIAMQGPWDPEDIERFEFVDDFEVDGLQNEYRTFGLGVPLIAVQKRRDATRRDWFKNKESPNFYPRDLAVPITAFVRIAPQINPETGQKTLNKTTIELYDPLQQTSVMLDNTIVPLESDFSTPLAYFLDDPVVNTKVFSTLAMLDANFAKDFRGLYMLEPYDPDRIPVVMVHGFWSSPITWMQMFNDLRGMSEIRKNYQFWFYLYPTGQPFWISAQQMRAELAQTRKLMDPNRESMAMQNMVLVGHSMGGLVSRMQTVQSGNDFWEIVSARSFQDLKADEETKERLRQMVYFEPNPAVSRVITLASPHRGSTFANGTTRFLGRTLFRLPEQYVDISNRVVEENPDFFHDTDMLTINTSIDSLSPNSPVLPALLNATPSSRVRYHNIVGEISQESFLDRVGSTVNGRGDGVVSLESSHFDRAISSIKVPAGHTEVHQHPLSIREVRRILLEHLTEYEANRFQFERTTTAGNPTPQLR